MESIIGQFSFSVAGSPAERRAAIDLIQTSYLQEFGHAPSDGADPGAVFLCALSRGGQLAGVLRLLLPLQRPYDFEKQVDVSRLPGVGKEVGLLGRLSLQSEFRSIRRGQVVQLGLFAKACSIALAEGLDTLLVYAPHKYRELYSMVGFQKTNALFTHPKANCEMEILHFDLTRLANSSDRQSRTLGLLRAMVSALNAEAQ